ncbi:hypothetical protein G7Z17_g5725 [Cylindrodendrum hubeiense]|uniref:LysM domain-containing protein n=1 Tax=Cylindrodendrum hubeiense TaxID=595255 RepID=A0A9P5LFX4_9HYPO|nr:hypothetical protein G7Z17_g5725 [Cylindrodendrum hubeiense]
MNSSLRWLVMMMGASSAVAQLISTPDPAIGVDDQSTQVTLPFETVSSGTGIADPVLGLLPSLPIDGDESDGSPTQNTVIAVPTSESTPVNPEEESLLTSIATPTGGNAPVVNPVAGGSTGITTATGEYATGINTGSSEITTAITGSTPRNGTLEASRSGNSGTKDSYATTTESGATPSGTDSADDPGESGDSGSGSGDKSDGGTKDDDGDDDDDEADDGDNDEADDGDDNEADDGDDDEDETDDGNDDEGNDDDEAGSDNGSNDKDGSDSGSSDSGNSQNSAGGFSTTFGSITLIAGATAAQTSASATGTPSTVISIAHRQENGLAWSSSLSSFTASGVTAMMSLRNLVSFALTLATLFLFISSVSANIPTNTPTGECKPITWKAKERHDAPSHSWPARPKPTPSVPQKKKPYEAGDINCRYWANTHEHVNYDSCKKLVQRYRIDVETFFKLNPILDPDCGNIRPYTLYCVAGSRIVLPVFATRVPAPATKSTLPTANVVLLTMDSASVLANGVGAAVRGVNAVPAQVIAARGSVSLASVRTR